MANYTDQIPVLRGHLEEFLATLSNVVTLLEAERLARSARELNDNVRPTRLQAQLEQATVRIEGYLPEDEDVPEE